MHHLRLLLSYVLLFVLLFAAGCETSDSSLRNSGQSEAYILGFHDGRHSGMKESGNYFEHYVRDEQRYTTDAEYRAGWLAGEEEGKRIQNQANALTNSYEGYHIGKEAQKSSKVDAQKIGHEAMQGVDPKNFDSLK